MSDSAQLNQETRHPLLHGRFSVLNGLRAVFLFWVMFVHLPSSSVPGVLTNPHDRWRFGVDFFLAISGLLVTRSLYQSYQGALKKGEGMGAAVREFLIRRFARILPPYYLILLFLGVMALGLRGGLLEALKVNSGILISWPLFFANYAIPTTHHEIPHTLVILWSVSFQEQFYLLLAAFFAMGGVRLRELLLAAGIGSAALRLLHAFVLWKGEARAEYYTTWLHLNFDAISWGCLAWLYYDRLGALFSTRGRAWASTLLILAGDAFVIAGRSFWYEDSATIALIACMKAPLLALTVRAVCELEEKKSLLASMLRNKTLGQIGVVSYEVYLIHVILYGLLEKLRVPAGPIYLAAAYGSSIILGLLFYRFFGRPSQEWMKKTLRKIFGPASIPAKA